jgi:hypothetical protein
MAASADAFFAIERPCKLFKALYLHLIGSAERDEIVIEILAAEGVYRRLKLCRRCRAADEQHLEQSVVRNDLLSEEIERSGKLA